MRWSTAAGGAAAAVIMLTWWSKSRRCSGVALISMPMTTGAPHRCVTWCSAIAA